MTETLSPAKSWNLTTPTQEATSALLPAWQNSILEHSRISLEQCNQFRCCLPGHIKHLPPCKDVCWDWKDVPKLCIHTGQMDNYLQPHREVALGFGSHHSKGCDKLPAKLSANPVSFCLGHCQCICHVQRKLYTRYKFGKDCCHQAHAVNKFVSSPIEITRRFFTDIVKTSIRPWKTSFSFQWFEPALPFYGEAVLK